MKIDTIKLAVEEFSIDETNEVFKQVMNPQYNSDGDLTSWHLWMNDPLNQIDAYACERKTGSVHQKYMKLNRCAGSVEETKEKFGNIKEGLSKNGVTYEEEYITELHIYQDFISGIPFKVWQTMLEASVQVEKESSKDTSKMFFAKDDNVFNSFKSENSCWGIRIYNKHQHVEQLNKEFYGGKNPFMQNTVRVEIFIKKFNNKLKLEDLTDEMLKEVFERKLMEAMKNIFSERSQELLGCLSGKSKTKEIADYIKCITSRAISLSDSLLTKGSLDYELDQLFKNEKSSTRRTKKQRVFEALDKKLIYYLEDNEAIHSELLSLLSEKANEKLNS